MAINTLPHELWSKVISFLVRDIPEPRTTKHWFDLHQDDLCSMMRVNTTFHDLTAPYLYDKTVVPCITAFMRNIETFEVGGKKVEIKVIKPGIKTKKDMLAYVREIHFVYYPTIFEPTYEKLMKGSTDEEERWKHIGMTTKQLLDVEHQFMFNRASQLAGNVTLQNDILAAGNDFNPFPKLDTITVGANGDEMWEIRERLLTGPGDFAGQMMRQSLAQSKMMTLAILSVSQPSHVCLHSMYGLCSPPTDTMFKPKSPSKLETFNVHVDQMPIDMHTLEGHWPIIICGTLNRWLYRFPFTRFDLGGAQDDSLFLSLEILADALNSTYRHFRTTHLFDGGDTVDLKNTHLEIWGFGNCDPLFDRIDAMLAPDQLDNDDTAFDMAYDRCFKEDQTALEHLEKGFDDLLCEAWKGKVSFHQNDFVMPCEGCDYHQDIDSGFGE